MKYIILILGGLLLLSGCQQADDEPEPTTDSSAVTAQKDSIRDLKPGFDYVTQIPDSLQTPEQQKLAKQLLEISIEHVKAVDNHMVFDMSRDQFRRTGVPIEYYRLFKKGMNDMNRYFKKRNIKNVNKMMEEYHHMARKVLKEKYNAPADTTYFALQTAMIKRAEVEKVALPRGDRYRVNIQLKDRYREEYARATEESIGQIFALTYHGDILASPMVNTKITSGRTTTGIFKTRAQAEEIKRRILGKQE